MPIENNTPSPNSRRGQRIAERANAWGTIQIRVVGVILIALSFATYFQVQSFVTKEKTKGNQVSALSQALISEQDGVKSRGDKPVAPAPEKIIKSPEIVQIPGPPGPRGASGQPGKNGEDGKDGQNGSNASLPPIDELKGEKGDPGEPGLSIPGKDGTNGKDGVDGKDGKDGKDGSPPTDITITIDGTTYLCTPVKAGATSFTCEAKSSPSSTPLIGAN